MEKTKTGIIVSGAEGSFSHKAALEYVSKNNLEYPIHYGLDMEGVLKALLEGEISLGVMPIYNTLGGEVVQATDAMKRYNFDKNFEILDCVLVQIEHCLMVLPAVNKGDISQIVSHPQPFLQCSRYVEENFPNTPRIEYQDMALAAEHLSKGTLPNSSAVIGSVKAAEIFGLRVLAQGIQDKHRGENITTFIVIRKK